MVPGGINVDEYSERLTLAAARAVVAFASLGQELERFSDAISTSVGALSVSREDPPKHEDQAVSLVLLIFIPRKYLAM